MIFKNTINGWKKINNPNHPITKMIKVSATNILFKSENEQVLIIESFAKMINSINIPIQILCESQDFNLNNLRLKIHNDDYYQFIQEKISENKITMKEFKIIVSHHDEIVLDNNIKVIQRNLKNCGLEAEDIECEPSKVFVPQELTPRYVKQDEYYCKTMYINNYPHMCSLGWLSDIYNNELNINISMFIHPVPKSQALKFLNRKLAENVSNSILEEELSADEFDENISSATKMRDDLYQNNGKFFFMSYYVTVKSKTIKQLKHDYEYMQNILEGMDIETKDLYYQEDIGLQSTMPKGIDFLIKQYNFTTQPLKYFFPFITSNIIDKDGLFIGENLLNSSLIFLDPFRYSSALMFVLGKVGVGKSYFTKLFCLRLLFMGVKVDIWDMDGEYLELKKLTNSQNLTIHHYKEKEQYRKQLNQYISAMERNKQELEPRYLIIDEFWNFLDDQEIVNGINKITLTGRKHYQGLCVINQMIEHLLEEEKALAILRNASIKALMGMELNCAKKVQEVLGLTDQETNFLVSADCEGILFAGSRHVQFKALANKNENDTITTNPLELKQRRINNVTTKAAATLTWKFI